MKSWSTRPLPQLPGNIEAPQLFDSASKTLRALPVAADASLYVCGITPYDATHMGHAATYLAFDLLGRVWRDSGASVNYVQNVTDIDDPLLERADRDGVDWRELAESQIELFRADMTALNVIAPQQYIGAIEAIQWIVPAVEELIAEGFAYRMDSGDVYFDTVAASVKTPDSSNAGELGAWWLGQISGLSPEEMLPVFAERGGDPERDGKRNPLDPLLWRVERAGEPAWPGASLGDGRPGWHIECTVIARKFLPAPFSVQGGGSDLLFPHHEMGDGHAWALDHTPLAKHYAHAGMVGLDGEKMSKSRGNLVLVSALRAEGVDPMAVRLSILANHYRSDWSWTAELLERSKLRLAQWRAAMEHTSVGSAAQLVSEIRTALAADLDAPTALNAVDNWVGQKATTEHSALDAALASDAIEALLGVVL
ncbi:cysteinyl-tRNA synthetase [Renibacterium salmoninarum ATCC 33209]|uniref:L-cysteine:1D-myo-inositol 2-amino-2-deoxy-alpha-D-glucopyranoside ligase n=1 Tax=Renibacterium salmoninarum (strain ATCC 33209 / DSM 20767 / JCM 11484 / NBRC 15589 / NCIMB 2235) TaxID=288705 RepID=MSHC_RENSM|nr:cysteine--1-D-myo-inosityl 2-amino-2-deoxy-alpha-D-glucopyranoside ligase [Renibacterium salmoninarum]A9WSI9.1 RecName: Full=L-cysteine:1D-myo-inositol 2-amino-2-deoxy-alpha-D-glucopyranoside ligase; Short=L-Cys:GlcN-Ins ligase; AltName: Full=Mycothiol ligase; Short=MSH ligase [Renibacterium salmoninarum ATCC 33209]ABY23777.1 cysteinyl-tRNA synthetase [Renibacterium salmoninarum ATCC 33209]